MSTAYLILENGKVFKGESFGFDGETEGELVFTTDMIGCLETLTNPCYCGQIVVQTFPLAGNYGVIPANFESENVWPKAYIVREWCRDPSNFRNEGDLDAFLKSREIPGICGIDTRALTRIIRDAGRMTARVSKNPVLTSSELASLMAYKVTGCVPEVSAKTPYYLNGGPDARYNIVVWDFGVKKSMLDALTSMGCNLAVVPADTPARKIAGLGPDGVVLSNGPGDPAENEDIIREIWTLSKNEFPTLAVGLGHQMLAIARGAKTARIGCGHYGSNHPVMDKYTGRVFITSQHHSYAVTEDSLPTSLNINYVNCNDGTCEGIEYADLPAFSVQFDPVCCAGDPDAKWLYRKFLDLVDTCMIGGGD